MRGVALVMGCLAGGIIAGVSPAVAASCPGNPDALGTSRTVVVDPVQMPRIGTIQYHNSLPLNDHEVVLTFDDGPLASYSERVLEALAAECVKVTYFMVGRMAAANPELVRRIYNAGHAIGTHSQNHPLTFDQMDMPRAESEINAGISSVQTALGDKRALAPFFRIPGLLRAQQVEHYLAGRSIAVWSADFVADDWYKNATPEDVVQKAMSRLEATKGKRGVLLLHDVQPATAMALPMLLRELKAKGYRVVQAVPPGQRPRLHDAPAAPMADRAPENVKQAGRDRDKNRGKEGTKEGGKQGGWPRVADRPAPPPETYRAGSRDTIFTTGSTGRRSQRDSYSDAGWTRFAR